MACRVDDSESTSDSVVPRAVPDAEVEQMEYDFIEQPSQDFFCPVTLDLLINPHQTTCCGNHLSKEAVERLQRDGKPCPMCQKSTLATVPDLFYKRKVNEIKARCPHKKSGCKWVGGVNEVKRHSDSCPKRPWQCQYCEFASTYEIGMSKHVPKCTKYPVVCPNSCEIGSVPRCDLEAHLTVCPLQPVECEYAEVGCDVKVPRRDLARHMEESQQQHLLSATLLILRLTRENTEEKNRLLRMIEEKKIQLNEKDETIADLQKQLIKEKDKLFRTVKEKDEEKKQQLKAKDKKIADFQERLRQVQQQTQKQLKDKDVEIVEKTQHFKRKEAEFRKELAVKDQHIIDRDKRITDLQNQLKQFQDRLEAKLTNLQQQVVKYGEDIQKPMKQQHKRAECLMFGQGFTLHKFTLTEFKKCQAQGDYGDWWSEPFYSHPGGYKFKLNICTNGDNSAQGFLSVYFQLLEGDHDDELDWPITATAHIQLLNQLGDHNSINSDVYSSSQSFLASFAQVRTPVNS